MFKDIAFLVCGAGFAGVFGFYTANPLYGLVIFAAMLFVRHLTTPEMLGGNRE